MFKVELINPFLEAAYEVFDVEMNLKIEKGPISMRESSITSQEVNVLVGVTGEVHGQIIYGMPSTTAKKIAAKMVGQPMITLNDLAQSSISELGNIITGFATTKLAESFSNLALTPPTLVIGKKVLISTIDIRRLYVVLMSKIGNLEVSVALREDPIPCRVDVMRSCKATAKVLT